jgi:fumarylacetoacetate (FAA) hydrolase
VGTPPAVADEEADPFRQPSFVAFSPNALTPDELGAAWDGRKIHLTLEAQINDAPLGAPDAAADMQFDFPALIVAAAATRGLGAGTLIGSGAVSSRDALAGAVSIAEKRAIEQHGKSAPETAFLQTGDRLRIDMCDASGHSLFGAIEQTVVSATAPTPHAAPQNDLPPDAVLSSDAMPETEPAP